MAAIGSAVGLGNVWRFPYMCYSMGGGTFLIPYLIAVFSAGIPLMILEFSFGHWARRSPPEAFKKISKKWEWLGWWTTLIPFVIATFYVVILAWCFAYIIYSIDIRWADQTLTFFTYFTGDTGNPVEFGGISIPVLLALLVIWYSIYFTLYKGVKRLEKAMSYLIFTSLIILVIFTIRGLTLPGATDGIYYYLIPDFSKLLDANVWLSAYAQVFFSLGLGAGVMITYASYLKKDSDISSSAFIISLADASVALIAGFAVFSVVGYLAFSQGTTVTNLQNLQGPALTFITFPTAISLFPFASIFGVLFFIVLLFFGLTSAFSMIEPSSNALHDKWGISKEKTTGFMCILGFFISIIFVTGNGVYLIDIVNIFISNFGLVTIGILECLCLGWVYKVSFLREHVNKTSKIVIGRWWDFSIKYLTPAILILLLIFSIVTYTKPINIPWLLIIIIGIIPIILMIVVSFTLSYIKGKDEIS